MLAPKFFQEKPGIWGWAANSFMQASMVYRERAVNYYLTPIFSRQNYANFKIKILIQASGTRRLLANYSRNNEVTVLTRRVGKKMTSLNFQCATSAVPLQTVFYNIEMNHQSCRVHKLAYCPCMHRASFVYTRGACPYFMSPRPHNMSPSVCRT